MGFFSSLFARKSNTNRVSLKGQAYNSTVASIPPIQGTYPVAGNGPNVLDQLQRAARKRSQAQLSMVSQEVDIDPAAPPPLVPRFRGFSPSRPTTAPNQANSLSSRPRSISRSIRSSNSAWSVPERPARGRAERLPPVPSIPTHHRRESSADSSQDKRNSFIDVLDAQGEFKPSNFRSRVAASGAREYGEDVAERNLGENGVNLNSAAAKAFYRLSGSGRLAMQANEGQSYEYEEDDDDDSAPAPGVPHGDLGTIREAWSRPTSSSAWRSFSGPIGSDMLRSSKSHLRDRRPEQSQASLNPGTTSMRDRRRSFNAFASPPPEPERRKPRPLSLHPSLTNFSSITPSSPPPVQRSRPKTSEGRSRGRSFGRVEIEPVVDEAFEDFDEPAPCPAVPARFKQSEQRTSTYLEPNYRYDTRHDTNYTRPESFHGASALSSYSRSEISQPSRPSSSSSIDKPFPKSRSLAGAALRNQRLDDINEHIPVRTSSLTGKSQPCVTPTTMSSGFSSNQYPRSISHHTPSTSIDASLPPSIKMRPEHEQSNVVNQNSYFNPADDDFSADTLVPSRMDIERDLGHPMNGGLELDLYVSDASEDSIDSFVAWKEKRRDGEGLLMKDNYGMAGDGLPGLFEPLPILKASAEPPPIPKVPSEPVVSKRPKTPKSPKSPRRPSTRSNRSTPRRSRHQPSLQSRSRTNTPRRTRRGSSSDEQDSDSFWENDIPPGPSFVSLADLGIDLRQLGLDQYGLTEADDAKVDIQTAIKLRKAMKHRDRRRREEDEACAADTED
ncbi:hypothetical protein NW762_011280 [Fusarium torreyae]|uniref:Uncharacterized protein n=1 Tax=Fusarium torreyae TaxID=1237075 RepID=A0A9W8RQ48_9HYPO|nr:hypothetical protein NW762_011280 [Fusarium torreyae]